jgi:Trm5-related predicted tRNA methylase
LLQSCVKSSETLDNKDKRVEIEYVDVEIFPYSEFLDFDENLKQMHSIFTLTKIHRAYTVPKKSEIKVPIEEFIQMEEIQNKLSKRDKSSSVSVSKDYFSEKIKKIKDQKDQVVVDTSEIFRLSIEEEDKLVKQVAFAESHSNFLEIYYQQK